MRIGIVASRFNEEITGELLKRAQGEARFGLRLDKGVEGVRAAVEMAKLRASVHEAR